MTQLFSNGILLRNPIKMALKWGILSAGRIAQDFVNAIRALPASEHEVLAVAARSQTNADKFAKELNIPRAYGGYLKLAQDKDVEIVYVGTQAPQHYENVKMLLENGKNVLCEKPFNINQRQTKKLVELARKKKLFLMEAVWSRCFPAYAEIRRILDSGEIGDVLFVSVAFGQDLSHVPRLQNKESGGGSSLDLGVYTLQFQQFVFKGLKPTKVVSTGHLNKNGVDETCSAILTYPGGKMAVLTSSLKACLPNEGLIVGTKGSLKVPNFWCPTEVITPNQTLEFPLPESEAEFLHVNSAGLAYEADEVRKCIRTGKLECPLMTLDESVELSELMDLLRQNAGCVLPKDLMEF